MDWKQVKRFREAEKQRDGRRETGDSDRDRDKEKETQAERLRD